MQDLQIRTGDVNRKLCSELGGPPLPGGERVGVRGFEPIERFVPPHPTPLPNGEREQTAVAARVQLNLKNGRDQARETSDED
jgi:hypothetical protein